MPPSRAERGAGRALLLLLGVASCAPSTGPGTTPTPVPPPPSATPRDTSGPTVVPPPTVRQPVAPASLARIRGWMPLSATGVPGFLAAHPQWDGRGVLIGILDSGIDAGAAGLDSTSGGRAKLVDLRNFSDEGVVPLSPVTPEGDTVVVAGRRLGGFSRVRAVAGGGPWFAGVVRERSLGDPPASDLNDNGLNSDTLVVIVARASDGWILLADTDGDGSLGGEAPVHDYLVARETFGWHPPGQPTTLTIAANLSDGPDRPRLSLFFDTSAHGTHVSGIASGWRIGHEAGFNGVAPGAQLLGLKIARNDFGGITTTGSVLAAMDYAIRFAARHGLPLVLNMSFGVGNEQEGAARLDALIDSVLAAHPDVTFVTSAGNDGPGLSTMGFPGSSRRAITVGGTEPWALSAGAITGGKVTPDALLFFSSRGGEVAKPDIVAPGIAYSTVPRWNMGDEFKGGTSMSSPHVAGLVALLLSAAQQERRAVTAGNIRRALLGSAVRVAGETYLDQGAGVPNLPSAWDILRGPAPPAEFEVATLGRGVSAAYQLSPAAADTIVRFRVTRVSGTGTVQVTLSSDASWLVPPPSVSLHGPVDTIVLVQHPPRQPGVHVAAVRATATGVPGPLFTMVSASVVPTTASAMPLRSTAPLHAGASRRIFFAVDSGRAFRVRAFTASPREHLIAALHQPGGAPNLGENGIPGSADTAAAVYDVDGADALRGIWEAVVVASSDAAVTASIAIDHAPVSLRFLPGAKALTATVASLVDSTVTGRLDLGMAGVQRQFAVGGAGSEDTRVRFTLPKWVRHIIFDLELDPAQWPRFTDFGFSVLDADGRILGKSPANYAHARLSADLPPRDADQEATIVLSPAFAEIGSTERWTGRVTGELHAERPVALEAGEGDEFRLAPRGSLGFHFKLDDPPWTLPAGFGPLLIGVVESAGLSWTWRAGPVPR